MNKKTAALKLAEEALKSCESGNWSMSYDELAVDEALAVIREALAEQEKQEPVYAFRRRGLDDFCTCTKERYEELVDKPNLFEVTTFYAAPVSAKREWADLTDDEIFKLGKEKKFPDTDPVYFARAIIAAYKEKNK